MAFVLGLPELPAETLDDKRPQQLAEYLGISQ
jgi:hypothetical protein